MSIMVQYHVPDAHQTVIVTGGVAGGGITNCHVQGLPPTCVSTCVPLCGNGLPAQSVMPLNTAVMRSGVAPEQQTQATPGVIAPQHSQVRARLVTRNCEPSLASLLGTAASRRLFQFVDKQICSVTSKTHDTDRTA